MNSSLFSVIKPPLLHTISGPTRQCSAYIGRSSAKNSGAGPTQRCGQSSSPVKFDCLVQGKPAVVELRSLIRFSIVAGDPIMMLASIF